MSATDELDPTSDRLVFPDGTEYRFIEKPSNPRSQPLVMEFVIQPDATGPPPHIHPTPVRETFEVTEGEFELREGKEWKRLKEGDSLTVEPGTVHTFRNKSGAVVRVRNVHDPAHGFEGYMRGIATIVKDNGSTKFTPKAVLRLAMLWREYQDTIQAGDSAMGAGMTMLAAVGKVLRIRA